jgi:hypothetical protein
MHTWVKDEDQPRGRPTATSRMVRRVGNLSVARKRVASEYRRRARSIVGGAGGGVPGIDRRAEHHDFVRRLVARQFGHQVGRIVAGIEPGFDGDAQLSCLVSRNQPHQPIPRCTGVEDYGEE